MVKPAALQERNPALSVKEGSSAEETGNYIENCFVIMYSSAYTFTYHLQNMLNVNNFNVLNLMHGINCTHFVLCETCKL